MAHIPLTQAERALCFVPAHEQFARAKERRERMSRQVLIHSRPVRIEPNVEQESVSIDENNAGIPVAEFIERGVFDLSREWKNLPALVDAMIEFMSATGIKPIRTSKDCMFFMKAIELWARLNDGDLACKRRMHEYIIPRRYYIQQMKVFSAWSFPKLSKPVGVDHSSAVHACQQPLVGLYDVYMDGRITPPRRSINHVVRMDKPLGSKKRIIKGKRWTYDRDQMLIAMVRQGMTQPNITDVFGGTFTQCSIAHRVKTLRTRGQL